MPTQTPSERLTAEEWLAMLVAGNPTERLRERQGAWEAIPRAGNPLLRLRLMLGDWQA